MRTEVLVCALVALTCVRCEEIPPKSLQDFLLEDADDRNEANSTIEDVRSGTVAGFCPQVCIDQGCLIGSTKVGNRQPYEAYYGIPYAEPPVGELRFKNPVEPGKFECLWDSTYHRNACLHNSIRTGNIIGSEDCLYLNVYKPTGVKLDKKNRLPVLVFLHGSSYKYGSSDPDYYGPEYLMDSRKVILVTLQYRQGPFGFLSSGDSNCQGNFGLKDQNMALKWIQANIREFGGDPKRVTLMGDDSGAACAHFQVMSHRSDDLFEKAILVGGNALAFWSYDKSGVDDFKAYAKLAGISRSDRTDTAKVMRKLMKMSANDLQALSHEMFSFHKVSKVFRPVIEGNWKGAFIRESPHTIWKSGDYQQRPIWFIAATWEQGHFADVVYDSDIKKAFLEDFDENLMVAGDLVPDSLPPIKKYFFNNNPRKNYGNIGELFKFWGYWHTVQYSVNLYTKYADIYKNPVDLLLFAFPTHFSISSQIHNYWKPEESPSHSDSMLFLFPHKIYSEHFVRGDAEDSAKDLFVKLITKYVTQGLPHSSHSYPYCNKRKSKVFCDYLSIVREDDKAVLVSNDTYDEGTIKVLNQVYDTLDLE